MSPQFAAAAVLATVLAVVPSGAAAQEAIALPKIDVATTTVAAFVQPAALDVRQLDFDAAIVPARLGRSRMLASLLASTVVMQALDVHSTYQALGRGAVEANPLMAGATRNRTAFIATKAAVAAATVLAVNRMGKRNKVAAIATLVAINSAYAIVVDHNYRVARGLR